MNSPALLCIDDRPQMLELHKTTLEPHGYCVKLATSSYTAIKTLEETSVAAVLLEYKQEGMDAEAVACHIKQRFPNLPIILLSAYSEMPEQILWLVDEFLLEYKQEGMDAEAVACHIKQRFPNLPIILLSAYSEMPEQILWLVDEYVMKSELAERLVPMIERAYQRAPTSTEPLQGGGATAETKGPRT